MELCKQYKTLCLNENKERIREGFDLDFQENLPQYLDDIERIIKCSVKSTVTDYDCQNSSLTIYGKSIISITYKSCNSCILSNIFEEEFTKSFDVNNCENFSFAKVRLNTKYSNFHLINQRRIDVHTSLSVNIETYCNNSVECLSECEKALFKNYTSECLSCKACGVTSLDFDESITVINNDTQIKNIINCSAGCRIDETKIIKDKMLVKGTVSACFIYECINGAIEKSFHSFTVSKIIETANLEESDTAFVCASISNVYVKAKADDSNCLRIIEFVGKAVIDYQIYRVEELSLNVDSYVPHHTSSQSNSNIMLKVNPTYYYDDKTVEMLFECDNSLVEIIDLKAEIVKQQIVNSKLVFEVNLSFIYYDDSSNICYYEKMQEAEIVLSDTELTGCCNANMISYDYVIKNTNQISIRANIEYSAYLYTDRSVNYITDIDVSDEKISSNAPQLTLYFANQNEEVWEIAKKFSTSVSLITEENSLTSDVIDGKRILLIPGM